MYDIIISGYYGFDNSGDDALLMAIIHDIREIDKDLKILVLSNNPKQTEKNYNVSAISRVNVFKILKEMKKSKLLINGGGSLIQNVTSFKSMLYYLGVIIMAKMSNMKIIIYANGIGPVNGPLSRKFAGCILNKVDYITLREKASSEVLKELNVTIPPVELTADPAFNILPSNVQKIDTILNNVGISQDSKIIGYSLRSWGNTDKNICIIAEAADYINEKYGTCSLFLPLDYPEDIDISQKVISKMKTKGFLLEKKYTVSDIIGVIGKMDLLVGMRLHSLIYSINAQTPMFGLIYDPKVKGLLEYCGGISGIEIEKINNEIFINSLEKAWIDRLKTKKIIEQYLSEFKDKAKKNAKIAISLLKRAGE